MGVSGAYAVGGYLQDREKNSQLKGSRKFTNYEEVLSNVSVVAAGLRYFVNLAAKADWTVEPVDDSPQAKEYAEFVERLMEDVDSSWSKIHRQSTMFRFNGFNVQEWTARRFDDGLIGFKSIENRPAYTIERWDIDQQGTVIGFGQRHPFTGEELYIPRGKTVYLVDDTISDQPDGMGLMRHCYEPAKRLQQYLRLEQQGYERDLRGIPVGRVPFQALNKAVQDGTMTEAEAQAAINAMEEMVKIQQKSSDTGIILDSKTYESVGADNLNVSNQLQWDLKLLEGSTNGLQEINVSIERLNYEIARIMGVEGLLLGGGQGSQALAKEKTNNFMLQVNATNKDICDQYQKDLIDTIWRLNGFPDEMKPKLKIEEVSQRDAESVAAILSDMARAGAVLSPDDPVIDDVRDLIGVSRTPEVEMTEEDLM